MVNRPSVFVVIFLATGIAASSSPQRETGPAPATTDSPWNVLAYGGKGEMHGAPICGPLGDFSKSPLRFDFDSDFYGEEASGLVTHADETFIGEISSRKIYEVKQTVRSADPAPPTTKMLLVERAPGQFCAIFENQYSYNPTNETDESAIVEIEGRRYLKNDETDAHTWYLDYWAIDEKGATRLNLDTLYKSIRSSVPKGLEMVNEPLDLSKSHLQIRVESADHTRAGVLQFHVAIKGRDVVILQKRWVPDSGFRDEH